MAMGCLAGCKKSLSWTDPLNHKKRADNFSARFLFSDSPQLYFPTTSLPELEPAAGNELPFPLSPPLSTHHSRLSGFPFLLLMTHPFVHSLPTKQNLKWSLKGVGIIHNDERVVEGSDLEKFTMMAFLQNAAKTNCDLGKFRWKSIDWSRQTKVKDFFGGGEEMEKNVEMKSYLRLSHSPPGSLSNTFWRQWEREMTNVRSREREKAVEKIWNQNDETVYFIANYYSTKGHEFLRHQISFFQKHWGGWWGSICDSFSLLVDEMWLVGAPLFVVILCCDPFSLLVEEMWVLHSQRTESTECPTAGNLDWSPTGTTHMENILT